jgi:sugar O-acyltransferase (sialic acid O-acetyltransferase NeuD family)
LTTIQPIIIFGAGGFAREVLQVVLDINAIAPTWMPVGFLVDPAVDAPLSVHGLPVMRDAAWLQDHPDTRWVVAVGSSLGRLRIAERLAGSCSNNCATLVHPRAWVGQRVQIGPGSIVCAGALVTTDIRIGHHVHVNIGCTVGHDAVLEDFATLNPSVNVSGNVRIGMATEVGTGTVLIPHADIGDWSIIGAGSVVTKPMPANVTAVGAPARIVKTREPGWWRDSSSH